MDKSEVIIIGAARSGTKFLRDILAQSSQLATIPFDISFVWRTGQEIASHDVLDPAELTEAQKRSLRNTVTRLAHRQRGSSANALLEKTVSNSLRVSFVDAVFPEACYIHLIRDGRDVVESSMRAWVEPAKLRYLVRKMRYFPIRNARYAAWYLRNRVLSRRAGTAVWGPRYPGIEADLASHGLLYTCARQWVECVERATQDLSRIEGSRVLSIRYEDLVSGPKVVEEIGAYLGLADSRAMLDAYHSALRENTIGRWKRLGDAEIERLGAIMNPVLGNLGYR